MKHEIVEKKHMEEVFAKYMERRIKAEEKVVSRPEISLLIHYRTSSSNITRRG